MNIKLNYLYRDAGNYKVYDSVIFSNPDNISVSQIKESLLEKFIDQEYFNPDDFKISRLSHPDYNPDFDHSWNEFESLESTNEAPTDPRNIKEFVNNSTDR